MDARLAILHSNVHVQAENQIAASYGFHILDDGVVAFVGIDLLLTPVGEWMGAGSGDPQAILARQADDAATERANLLARLVDVMADASADLYYTLMHLGFYGFVELKLAFRDDLGVDVRSEVARDGIDRLILFLDTDSKAGLHGC